MINNNNLHTRIIKAPVSIVKMLIKLNFFIITYLK